MPKSVQLVSIFLVSPEDALNQRDMLEKCINDWNESYGKDKNTRLEVLKWEKEISATSHTLPQDLINQEILPYADILVGVFSSLTKNTESGTLETIEQFIKSHKPVMMYFDNTPTPPADMDLDSLKAINSFKEKYKNRHIYSEVDFSQEDILRKVFTKNLSRNVDLALKGMAKTDVAMDTPSASTTKATENQSWYDISISKQIINYLEENDYLEFTIRREISIYENRELWRRNVTAEEYSQLIRTLDTARESAFSSKYGEYDYTKDLRTNYPNWHNHIQKFLAEHTDKTTSYNILGVASNYGLELNQIFQEYEQSKFTVLDISKTALKRGKKEFPLLTFKHGEMEDTHLSNKEYDIYLNLRSIHSSGADTKKTLLECHRVLKPGGLAIFSVSDGYLAPVPDKPGTLKEVKGMLDRKTGLFLDHQPTLLALKIKQKLADYRFVDIELHTGKTEVFVFGRSPF